MVSFSLFANGPCTLLMIVVLLVSNIILVLKKPNLPNNPESSDQKRNLLWAIPPVVVGLCLITVAMYFISSEEYGLFILSTFMMGQIQHCILISYITKTPKLKDFFCRTYQSSKTKILFEPIYFTVETIYDCFVFLICFGQTIQHFKHTKPFLPANQIQPISPQKLEV